MPETEFDVCVIGTGAGGGVMIDRLTAAGFRVVALGRGPELSLAAPPPAPPRQPSWLPADAR